MFISFKFSLGSNPKMKSYSRASYWFFLQNLLRSLIKNLQEPQELFFIPPSPSNLKPDATQPPLSPFFRRSTVLIHRGTTKEFRSSLLAISAITQRDVASKSYWEIIDKKATFRFLQARELIKRRKKRWDEKEILNVTHQFTGRF